MAREIADGVWLLDLGLVPPMATNCFLLDEREMSGGPYDDPSVTLCDVGYWRNRPSLRSELADAGYGPADLDCVLLTHYDLDHVTGLARLAPEFDGPVYVGAPDYRLLTGDADPPLLHHKGLFHRVARRLFPLPDRFDVRPVADGERVGRFTAYVTPGHNPGHAVYVHDAGVALLGDLVWGNGDLTVPFWLDSYDVAESRASVRSVVERAPPFDVAAMSHGTPLVRDGSDALRALADGFDDDGGVTGPE
ncbi:MBL fold metallo-hydrolase [Halomicrobium salinisoli]|uniref:MBL fold metallo-hydrolase n=1 Tax=Halomicrobium salinisoli TaxID=2878391 RepID=UPI001CF04D80|nr:MBL fold metallo-hydrolase [Halomicrobium salinisoli]